MVHAFRTPSLGAVVALFVAAPLATAQPMTPPGSPSGWSYSAHVRTSIGSGVLDLGTHRLGTDPSGNGTVDPVFGDYLITAPLPEATLTGTYPAGTGNDPIRLFSVGQGYSVIPVEEASAAPRDSRFLLSFTLTDLASGRSGTLEFTGRVGVATSGEYPTRVLFSADLSPTIEQLTLGENRYRVTALGGLPDEIDEPASIGVRVETLATTPEPGTLALAGMGLGVVGVRRWRR